MMASFYYYDQDPSGFCFFCKLGLFYLNPTGATKFTYQRKKEKNAVRSSRNDAIVQMAYSKVKKNGKFAF